MKEYTLCYEGPECPHCGEIITPDEGIYYDEYNYTKDECGGCGKKFSVEVNNTTYWYCKPIEEDKT